MAKKDDDKDDFYVEFQKDFAYRGVHLGKGFVLDGREDRAWAEYICLDANLAKRVSKPDYEVTRPWEEAAKIEKAEREAEKAAKAVNPAARHPLTPYSYDAPQAKR